MKITKFVHACVLVESEGKSVLFDPGIYSWNSGLIDLSSFPDLTTIIVSHKHADHCAEPFVRALVDTFPDAEWFAPHDAQEDLLNWGVTELNFESDEETEVIDNPHAHVEPIGAPVQNITTHWNNLVTHPGDTHVIDKTNDVLLLPVEAPWGTTVAAVELAQDLAPKYVLPIHDSMWSDTWRDNMYANLAQFFADTEIEFLSPVDGESTQLPLPN